jgi:RNA polymerase sigma-70 factor (ECF subfamily)
MRLVAVNPRGEGGRDDARDLELLGRIARGDRHAFEAFYRDYHGRLTRFLARLTPQRTVVEEVVNDTLWTVWRNASAFRGSSRVSTWVMGIAWRCGLKAVRRSAGEASARGVEPAEPPATQPFAEHETREWIRQGLRQLPAEQRTTLELAYYFGHSLEEIAQIMDCPVGTVKGRLFHARIKLRNLLPALGGGGSGEDHEAL